MALARRFLEEIGLVTLYRAPKDVRLLMLQRFVRMLAYGASTLILALYLSALGVSETRIGLFMSLTLMGDIFISFVLTLSADRLGRRRVLALGALLVSCSGVVFATVGNYWILLAAAIFGVISPSGNEIGPFRAIEDSTLAQLTPYAVRSDIFAWHNLIGKVGHASGMITSGWVVQHLRTGDGWEAVPAYRVIFLAYAVFGLLKFALTFFLSESCEAEKEETDETQSDGPLEAAPLLGDVLPPKGTATSGWSLLPRINPESAVIVTTLCVLFAVNSLGTGLVPSSWVTYFFHRKFDLDEGKLGSLFFVASIIAAVSNLVASSISKRIGLIRTMVFTHLPSAVMLALIPIPDSVYLAMTFLVLRACTQSMDSAPRSAFISSVVRPSERTAVIGILNVVKTSSQSFGPLITGALAGADLFWVSFVVAGSLKMSYDLGVLAMFQNHKTYGERRAEAEREASETAHEDEENGNSEETIHEP